MASGQFTYRRTNGSAYDPWFRLGSVDATTTTIITALVVLSIFLFAISPTLVGLLAFGDVFRNGHVWRLVTWPFYNGIGLGTVISAAMFWYFGSRIEELLGRRRLVAFLLVLTIIPAVIVCGLFAAGIFNGYASLKLISGISALSSAMFLAYTIEYPNVRMYFGIKAWQIAGVILLIRVLQFLSVRDWISLSLLLLTLLLMVGAMRSFGLAEPLKQVPKLPFLGRVRTTRKKKGSGRGANPLRNSRSSSGGAGSGKASGTSRADRNDRNDSDAPATAKVVRGPWPSGGITQFEVDRLLEKIGTSGMESLTSEERTTLEQASKNLRDRNG